MRQGNALEGRDALLVGLLEPLAGDLGFRLGLATLEYVETGPAEGPGIDPHYEWDGSLCDIDPEKLYLVDVDEREISITNLIDLKGQPLAIGSKVVSDEECIPTDLQDVIGAGVPYDRVYEGSDVRAPAISLWVGPSLTTIFQCGGELTVCECITVRLKVGHRLIFPISISADRSRHLADSEYESPHFKFQSTSRQMAW